MSDLNSSRTLTYRPFAETDLPAAHRLSEAVKWPHRLDDWRFAFQLGSGIVAEDETGVVGTALGWRLAESREASTCRRNAALISSGVSAWIFASSCSSHCIVRPSCSCDAS